MFRFYGFSERDMSFKYIRRLWSNSSPYADKDTDSGDGKSENDDESHPFILLDEHVRILAYNLRYFYLEKWNNWIG